MTKLSQLEKQLQADNLDCLLITSEVNRRYVSGFTGTAGMVLVGEHIKKFITDFRYMDQAREQVKDFDVVEHKKSILATIQEELAAAGVKRLGFEKQHVTYAQYEQLQKELHVELIPVDGLIEQLRLTKTDAELQIMKKAAEIADEAYKHIQTFIKPGVKEIDVSNELEFFMRKLGATSSSFDIIVASGVRSSLPHGVASQKEIQSGELVTLDYGAIYNGYCSDITRTVAVGDISSELKTIYDTVLEAQLKGVAGVKAGITGKEADALTRDHITEKGYGKYFGHSTGHGLGMDVHENPSLSPRSETILKPNMVVTVEPGIYIPNFGGCRIEDDLIVTEHGNERLTHATKELIYL